MAFSFKQTSIEKTLLKLGIKDANHSQAVKIALGVALILFIVLMFQHSESIPSSYPLGSVWEENDLAAPFSFPIDKDITSYGRERDEAARNVYPVFVRNDEITRAQIESLLIAINVLKGSVDAQSRMMKWSSRTDLSSIQAQRQKVPFPITDHQWRYLSRWPAGGRSGGYFKSLQESLVTILSSALHTGILNEQKSQLFGKEFALRKGRTETIIPLDQVLDGEEAMNTMQLQLASVFNDNDTSELGMSILRSVVRPNVILNQQETERSVQIAQENVPRTLGFVQEGEKIVAKNDRINPGVKLRLDSFEKVRIERGVVENDWKHWIGVTLHVMLVLGLYGIYIFLFRKGIFQDNTKLTIIALLLLLETWFAHISLSVNLSDPTQYLIFVPAASMLLTIIFDSRVGFYGTVTMAYLIAGMRGNDYSIALISLVAGSFGAYTVRDIRSRTQIFRSVGFVFFGYAISILALSIERFDSFTTIVTGLSYALANSLISPVLTYGLLVMFERVFKVTTDLTLVELSDFNQPLLRELSEKAPGTFHHSMTIGNLAEAAADAIGANTSLARVGGYYHDIGKMLKPEYFAENQVGNQNRHNRLRARMSALIVAAHVREGVELGRRYGLPEEVLDFITQHHGTTRISFFYDKALKQATKRPGKEIINEQEFLYPGPKPQTRETGIVMLADLIEAATRSPGETTIQRLESTIGNLIRRRFVEGQLDECDLTLRDLTEIRGAFLKILLGIHHQRITYPQEEQIGSPPANDLTTEVVTSADTDDDTSSPGPPQESVVSESTPPHREAGRITDASESDRPKL